MLERELEKDIIVHAANNSSSSEDGKPYNTVKIPNPKNEAEEFSFAFNGVYEQTTTQETLFSAEGNASSPSYPSSNSYSTTLHYPVIRRDHCQ